MEKLLAFGALSVLLLFAFEKTSTLVYSGIFKYIRHPLYSPLIFLT